MKNSYLSVANNPSKIIRSSFIVICLSLLSACGSLSGVAKHNVENAPRLAKDGSGVIYGAWLNGGTEGLEAVITACKAIENADPRCATPDQYRLGNTASAFGFSAGLAGALTLVPAEMNLKGCVTGSSNCTYLKVKVSQRMFGTLEEIASKPGEGKCKWSGLPRAGGVVCPAYDWDFRKDLNNWDTSNGAMTVK